MARKPSRSNKVVVSNRSALLTKYGGPGVKTIEKALHQLAKADKARGIETRLVYLDGAALGSKRVTNPSDPAENKVAIDAVYRKWTPEYLVILGSHDVVPYQELKNPLHDPGDAESDPDRFTGSDLPYACDAPYSQNIRKFLGPTRVVGRVPDITGAVSPAYLIRLLKTAGSLKTVTRPDSAFALSARVWEKSTKTSVRNILGAAPAVLTSPSEGPKFAKQPLGELVHFVNCHGDKDEHRFDGEGPADTYFTALDSRHLLGLRAGAVAAFECCYGAQLYNPAGLPAMAIANTYLASGAAGVLASTTIAYGPEEGNANADVICQVFVEQALRGASLGRALLEARLSYVNQQSVVDPYDEKTLAQFVLLGDPSVHPFRESDDGPAVKSPKVKAVEHAARLQRRVRLTKSGTRLGRESAYTVPVSATAPSAFRTRANAVKGRFGKLRLFKVQEPAEARQAVGKALGDMPRAKQILIATRRRRASGPGRTRIDGLLLYAVNGSMVECHLVSR